MTERLRAVECALKQWDAHYHEGIESQAYRGMELAAAVRVLVRGGSAPAPVTEYHAHLTQLQKRAKALRISEVLKFEHDSDVMKELRNFELVAALQIEIEQLTKRQREAEAESASRIAQLRKLSRFALILPIDVGSLQAVRVNDGPVAAPAILQGADEFQWIRAKDMDALLTPAAPHAEKGRNNE